MRMCVRACVHTSYNHLYKTCKKCKEKKKIEPARAALQQQSDNAPRKNEICKCKRHGTKFEVRKTLSAKECKNDLNVKRCSRIFLPFVLYIYIYIRNFIFFSAIMFMLMQFPYK